MDLLKQEASSLLFPWPPFSILLGPLLPEPDLYSITHGPQMLLFSFPSSMGGGAASTPEQAGLPPILQGKHLSFPKHLENTALFGLGSSGGSSMGKCPACGEPPSLWPLFLVLPQALAGETV